MLKANPFLIIIDFRRHSSIFQGPNIFQRKPFSDGKAFPDNTADSKGTSFSIKAVVNPGNNKQTKNIRLKDLDASKEANGVIYSTN